MHKLFRQISNATRYSVDGLAYLLRSEFAARIELYGLIFTLLLFVILNVPLVYYVIGFILFLLMLSAEALNTAIEVVIDRVSPEISHTGKRAKDLGSFAVLCVSLANFIFIAYVVLTANYGQVIPNVINKIWLIVILAIVGCVSFYFVKHVGLQSVSEDPDDISI